jgi:hypothetical protein
LENAATYGHQLIVLFPALLSFTKSVRITWHGIQSKLRAKRLNSILIQSPGQSAVPLEAMGEDEFKIDPVFGWRS